MLDTSHKRKSAVITFILLLLILFGVFNFGMKYSDPPIEYGVAINFGDSNEGYGNAVKATEKVSTEDVVEEKVEDVTIEEPITQEKPVAEVPVKETTPKVEEIVTQKTTKEVPVVESVEQKKQVEQTEQPKNKQKKVESKPKPKPSKAAKDALSSLLNNSNENTGDDNGEGDDVNKTGLKGKKSGDDKSSKYYGNGRNGLEGNYNLSGRSALLKPIQKPNCEEEGIVVVSIIVDKNGKVVKAVPGVRGTTNPAPCLFEAAKKAAKKTKWNEDTNAPNQQKGTIIYRFSLSG